jgi:AcrR family transcriptional regulator
VTRLRTIYSSAVATQAQEQPDLRTRVRKQARLEVARIALDLFAERGFDATTATEAAEAAGISRASFFRLFSSKEEAVLVAQEATGEAIREAIARRPKDEPIWIALREAFLVPTGRYLEDPEGSRARERVVRETAALNGRQVELHGQWVDAIQPIVAERLGKSPQSFDARVISVLAVSAFDSAKRFWGEGSGSSDLIELIERSFEIASALGKAS